MRTIPEYTSGWPVTDWTANVEVRQLIVSASAGQVSIPPAQFLVAIPPVYQRVPIRALTRAAFTAFRPGPASMLALEALRHRYPNRRLELVSSGTAALQLALSASRQSAQGVVALPAYACPDIATAAIGAGFRIELYDVDPNTLEPDFRSLERCFRAGATHVLAVHLYGRLVHVAAIQDAARQFGVTVIEDAAQHAGATRDGRRGGAFAPWSILSFGRGKGINAAGGGALLVQDDLPWQSPTLPEPQAAGRFFRLLAAIGTELAAHPLLFGMVSRIPSLGVGKTEYQPPRPSTAMNPVSSELLIEALARDDEAVAHRRQVATMYRERLAESPTNAFVPPTSVQEGALRFPIRLHREPGARASGLGIVRSYPRTLLDYPEIRQALHSQPGPLPGADELARTTYTLPTHERITARLVDSIVAILKE